MIPIREQHRALTRSQILRAARQLFETEPYHDISVEAIAKRAGVSRATVYLHFDNKRQILDELITDLRREADVLWPNLSVSNDRSAAALTPHVAAFLDAIRRHSGAFRAWMQAGVTEDDVAGTSRRDLDRVRLLVFPDAAPDDSDALARTVVLVSVIERFCVYWLDHELPIPPDTAAAILAEAMAGVIGAAPARTLVERTTG